MLPDEGHFAFISHFHVHLRFTILLPPPAKCWDCMCAWSYHYLVLTKSFYTPGKFLVFTCLLTLSLIIMQTIIEYVYSFYAWYQRQSVKRLAFISPQLGFEQTKDHKDIFTTTQSSVNVMSVKAWFHVFHTIAQGALLVDVTSQYQTLSSISWQFFRC